MGGYFGLGSCRAVAFSPMKKFSATNVRQDYVALGGLEDRDPGKSLLKERNRFHVKYIVDLISLSPFSIPAATIFYLPGYPIFVWRLVLATQRNGIILLSLFLWPMCRFWQPCQTKFSLSRVVLLLLLLRHGFLSHQKQPSCVKLKLSMAAFGGFE